MGRRIPPTVRGGAHRACVLENGCLVLAGPARDLLHDDRLKRACLGI